MGIAFGYAYAGSVSMLTVTFSDIRGVMMLGHSLTVITILLLMKPTLLTTMNTQPVPIQESKTKQEEILEADDEIVEDDDEESEKNTNAEEHLEDETWQEESVDWEQPPDAIDCEVDWDENEDLDEIETEIETSDDIELIEDD